MIHNITDRERELTCVISDLKAENVRLREAARMALDALERHQEYGSPTLLTGSMARHAITTLQEALGEQA